jgi:putative hemolysin
LEADPDSNNLILGFIHLLFINWNLFLSFFLIVVLLFCSACASASEIAYFSINNNNLKNLDDTDATLVSKVANLLRSPKKLLATILITNNFVNIGIVVVSEYLLEELLPETIYATPANFFIKLFSFAQFNVESVQRTLSFGVNVIGVTFLIVLFGEGIPKIFAKKNNLLIAKIMSTPLSILGKVFNPLIYLLVNSSGFIEKRLIANNSNLTTTKDELDDVIDLTVGNNKESETDILKRIVKFGEVTVRQIMNSRTDIIAIDFELNFKEVLNKVKEFGFSRLPVYHESIDNMTGILYAKDLIGVIDEASDFEWQALIRPNIIYTPESKKINELLKEFQIEKLHLAIVVNEYGGTEGLVTLEDIMEEVIGEIKDEFDDDREVNYKQIDANTFVFDGKTLLHDVTKIMDMDTDRFENVKGDAEALAGLVLEVAGGFPKKNEEYEIAGLRLKIISINKRRIEKVQIIIPNDDQE